MSENLPAIPSALAGPILRRLEKDKLSIWLVLSRTAEIRTAFSDNKIVQENIRHLKAGEHLTIS